MSETLRSRSSAILKLGLYYFIADMRRRRLGFLALLLEPIGTFIIFYFLLYMLMGRRSEELLWHFLVGVFTLSSMQVLANEIASSRNKGLGILSVTDIPFINVITIRSIVGFLNANIIVLVMMMILVVYGKSDFSFMLPVRLSVIWLLGIFFGLLFLTLKSFFTDFDIIIGMFYRVLFFTSGILFSADTVSPRIRDYVTQSPFLIAIADVRGTMTGDPGFAGYNSMYPLYLIAFVAIMSILLFLQYRLRMRNTR